MKKRNRSSKRPPISVSSGFYAQAQLAAQERGVTISQLVEQAVADLPAVEAISGRSP